MILDIDIGNSRLKWRLESGRSGVLARDQLQTLGETLASDRVTQVRTACVAGPEAERRFADWCVRTWNVQPWFARVQNRVAGLNIGYSEPERLGVDRWLAMLAAYHQEAGACAVLDAGTAITVDYIDVEGNHLGGLILPGLGAMAEVLSSRTHAVGAESLSLPQLWVPGKDTSGCVTNGLAAAGRGLVAEVTRFAEQACGPGVKFLVCGGDAGAITAFDPRLRLHEHLVLDGLVLAQRFLSHRS